MSTHLRQLQQWLRPLQRAPLHPQWLVLRHRRALFAWVAHRAHGTVLDIGCGNGELRDLVSPTVTYVGLDYPPTVDLGYRGRPDILGNAAHLPVRAASVDTVCLLDVLEHLAEPARALAEAARVLKPEGICLIHVPFVYPLHDEPHDFHRWTRYGLRHMLDACGLSVEEMSETTTPIETGAAMFCITVADACVKAMTRPSLALLFTPLAMLLVPLVNMLGWLLARLLPGGGLMTFSYRVVARLERATRITQPSLAPSDGIAAICGHKADGPGSCR